MDILSSLNFMSDEAKKMRVNQFDIFASISDQRGIDIFEGEVKETEISSSQGIGVRLISNKKLGYSFTQKFDEQSLKQVVRDALGHSKLLEPLEIDLPDASQSSIQSELDLNLWNDDLDNLSMSKIKNLGLELEELSLKSSSLIKNIPYLSLSYGSGAQYLKNSKGLFQNSKANTFYVDLGITAEKGDSIKMGYFSDSFKSLKEFNLIQFSKEAVSRSLELLGAKPIPSGKHPVVLSNRVTASLFGKYTNNFCADRVQKGLSRLKDKKGVKMAVSEFNLYSDPLIIGGSASYLWDDEGIASQRVNLIQNGVIQDYLYDLETAKKDNYISNGHASRDYADIVCPSSSNLIVDKGAQTLEDILKVYPKCLYVTELEGNSGCSSVSGEISIGAQGFWVEQGEIKHPVEEVTISGNFYDFLLNIKGISNTYRKERSSIKVPDLLTDCFFIAGS